MVLGLAACATSRTTPAYNGAAQPADLFVSKRPARPYSPKGFVETVQARGESADQVLERMRWMAARRGCDALIFLGAKDTVIGRRGWFLTRKGFRGSCVVYTSQPRQRAALAELYQPASEADQGPAAVELTATHLTPTLAAPAASIVTPLAANGGDAQQAL